MNPPLIPVIDLQNLAVDLARRLTLLQHFPLAASQLLTCEKSSEDEIRRHSRKIVTLIEIGRNALTGAGLKLYKFASCRDEFVPHKAAYFSLLEMLKRIRHLMDDSNLEARITKLLLPLSTYLRIGVTEKPGRSSSSVSPISQRRSSFSPPPYPPRTATPPRAQSTALAGSMPPPDDFSVGGFRIHSSISASRRVGHTFEKRRQAPSKSIVQPEDTSSEEEEEDEERLSFTIPRPRLKFGILCTNKSQVNRDRTERPIATAAY